MSLLEVNKITPQSGTTLTLGDTGDTINFGSGVLPNFENLTVTGDLTVDTNSLYVDSANNRVGIGTTSPDRSLHINTPSTQLKLQDSGQTDSFFEIVDSAGIVYMGSRNNTNNGQFVFRGLNSGGASEYMRIDSSGNLLVGTTDTGVGGTTNTGIALNPNGPSAISRSSNPPITLNRTTNDGTIALFYKDGSIIGSIGTEAGDLFIGTGDTNIKFIDGVDAINPSTATGIGRDNAIDLGRSGSRFKNLYLGGSVYLGGTGSANALDTYEEGTWTPSLTSSGGSVSASYGTRLGKYTRVGNIVHCSFSMRVASHSGGSGEYRVSGLPFTSNTAGNDHIGVSTAGLEGHPISSAIQNIQIIDNLKTYVRLLIAQNNTSWTTYTPQSNNSVYMSFTYPINQ